MSKAVIDALVERFPDAVYDAYVGVRRRRLRVREEGARSSSVCRFLKSDSAMRFDMAPYITAVDYLGPGARASRSSTTSLARRRTRAFACG